MKQAIIFIITLFTFSNSIFAASKSDDATFNFSSVEQLEYNSSNSSNLLQIKVNKTFNSNDENEKDLFGWICFAKLVSRTVQEGVDGNLYVTETYQVNCYYFDLSAYQLQPY
jgi:hypothetical protein